MRNPKKAKGLDGLALADLESCIHELQSKVPKNSVEPVVACLLYTSDAADE